MRRALRSCALLMVLAAAARTADPDANELFRKTREIVLDNARRLPRYMCVETVQRAQYAPAFSPTNCQSLIAAQRLAPKRGPAVERDRLRLDVAVDENGEIFSWAGARRFETSDVDKLVGTGAAGSGEFGSFLASVFGGAPDKIQYLGLRGGLGSFDYNVPLARSRYQFRTTGPGKIIAYRGSFQADPAGGDLKQLVVETEDFTQSDRVCRVTHTMNYQRAKIGDGDFLLPEVSVMEGLYSDGSIALNETHYSACRQYVGESTISFGDAAPVAGTEAARAASQPLPAGVRLSVGLSTAIDTATAAAGDRVEGILLRDARSAKGVVAHAKDRIYGRILRLESVMNVPPRWYITLRFDTIVRSGIEQPVKLVPLDDGVRNAPRIRIRVLAGEGDIPEGSGRFIFAGPADFVLDQKFHSEWETR